VEAGEKYRLFFNERNINNGNIEIRAIIDDTVCVYIKNGRYRMDDVSLLQMYIDGGHLTRC